MRNLEEEMLKPQIKEHLDTYTEDRAEDDLIYAYISRLNKKKSQGNKTYLSGRQMNDFD